MSSNTLQGFSMPIFSEVIVENSIDTDKSIYGSYTANIVIEKN